MKDSLSKWGVSRVVNGKHVTVCEVILQSMRAVQVNIWQKHTWIAHRLLQSILANLTEMNSETSAVCKFDSWNEDNNRVRMQLYHFWSTNSVNLTLKDVDQNEIGQQIDIVLRGTQKQWCELWMCLSHFWQRKNWASNLMRSKRADQVILDRNVPGYCPTIRPHRLRLSIWPKMSHQVKVPAAQIVEFQAGAEDSRYSFKVKYEGLLIKTRFQ